MSFDIEEIKIKFFTNIQKNEFKTIDFTRNMLYHPELVGMIETLNEYPYFTFDIKYPLATLRYLTYKERVEFFFDRNKFSERLSSYTKGKNILDKTKILEEQEDKQYKQKSKINEKDDGDEKSEKVYYSKRDKNIEHNVMAMIELLFPVKFPVINDIQTSFNLISDKSNIPYMVLDPIVTNYFSYLKLGDTTYTFKKLIWINDFLNHPLYQRLLLEYRRFWTWANEEKLKQKKIANRNYKNVKKTIDDAHNVITEELKKGAASIVGGTYIEIDLVPKIIELKFLTGTGLDVLNNFIKVHITKTNSAKVLSSIKDIDTITYEHYIDKYKRIVILFKEIEDLTKGIGITKKKKPENPQNLIKILNNSKLLTNDSIQKLTNYSLKSFINAMNQYSFIESLFNKTYAEVSSMKEPPIPAEYRNFAFSIMNEYKKPLRESTNVDLQELINSADNRNVKEFFEFLNFIYNKFIAGANVKIIEKYKNLLNVGMSYINTNVTQGQRREIYVYSDFIKGEVNNKNMESIFCPFVGDHLGNEFDFLARKTIYGKVGKKDTKKWDINRNRMIFSIKDSSSKSSLESETLTSEPTTQDFDKRIKEDTLNSVFMSEVVSKGSIKIGVEQKSIGDIIIAINKYPKPGQQQQITEQGLLSYIKNNDDDLYNAILQWNGDMTKRNQQLLENLIKIFSKYDGKMKTFESQKLLREYLSDPNKKATIDYNIDLLNLFIAVIQRLIDIEQMKAEDIGFKKGGRKTRKYKKNRNYFTRRNLHKSKY